MLQLQYLKLKKKKIKKSTFSIFPIPPWKISHSSFSSMPFYTSRSLYYFKERLENNWNPLSPGSSTIFPVTGTCCISFPCHQWAQYSERKIHSHVFHHRPMQAGFCTFTILLISTTILLNSLIHTQWVAISQDLSYHQTPIPSLFSADPCLIFWEYENLWQTFSPFSFLSP